MITGISPAYRRHSWLLSKFSATTAVPSVALAFITLSCSNLPHDHVALVCNRSSVAAACCSMCCCVCCVLLVLPRARPPAPSGRHPHPSCSSRGLLCCWSAACGTPYGQSSRTRRLIVSVFRRNHCNDSFGAMFIDTYTLEATGWKLVQTYLKCMYWVCVYTCCEPSPQPDTLETPSHTNNSLRSKSATPWNSCLFSQ